MHMTPHKLAEPQQIELHLKNQFRFHSSSKQFRAVVSLEQKLSRGTHYFTIYLYYQFKPTQVPAQKLLLWEAKQARSGHKQLHYWWMKNCGKLEFSNVADLSEKWKTLQKFAQIHRAKIIDHLLDYSDNHHHRLQAETMVNGFLFVLF